MKTNYSKAGIDKDSVTKRVLIELRRKIIQGVYPSGSRLLETELAAAFETSRGTIRNTMQELSGEGLVEFLDSGGCVVIGINEKIVRDTYHFRGLLETEAANILLSASDFSYTGMMSVLDQYLMRKENQLFQSNPYEYCVDLDMQFHQAMVATAQNRPIYRAWCSIAPVAKELLIMNVTPAYWEAYIDRFYSRHKKMLDYIILRDPKLLDEIKQQTNTGMEMSVYNLQQPHRAETPLNGNQAGVPEKN